MLRLLHNIILYLIIIRDRFDERHHDFGDEIDDSRRRLAGLELGEHMARVLRARSRFARNECKNARICHAADAEPPSVGRIESTIGDRVHGVVSSEKQSPSIVGDGHAVTAHFEVYTDGDDLVLSLLDERLIDGTAHRLWAGERFALAREDVCHVACCTLFE